VFPALGLKIDEIQAEPVLRDDPIDALVAVRAFDALLGCELSPAYGFLGLARAVRLAVDAM
jgi:hypothetical protein